MFQTNSPAERDALVWLQRRHSGQWTAGDDLALQAWLDAAPEHLAAWVHTEQLWTGLDCVRDLAQTDLQRARQILQSPSARPWRVAAWPVGAMALAVVAALVLRAVPGAFDEPRFVQTSRGQMETIFLPDGSHIDVNTHTRLKITTSLVCRCIELLDGEALFTVAHGDPRPFRVTTESVTIVDVGTVFWTRSESRGSSVAVSQGQVDVFERGGHSPHRLDAGQTVALDAKGHMLPAPALSVEELTAWREGQLVFHDAPLTDVFKEFARYHSVHFEMDARLSGYRLSGRLASGDLDKLLALLQAGYPATAKRVAPDLIQVSLRSP